MARPAGPKPDDPAQSKRFLDLAKQLEADGADNDLANAVRTLAPQKRAPEPRRQSGKSPKK